MLRFLERCLISSSCLRPLKSGFSLIQLSVMLTVASLAIVVVLPSPQAPVKNNATSTNKMNAIMIALRGYQATNCSLPCPADPLRATGDNYYGIAAANPGTGSPGNCIGGTPAAAYADTTKHIAIGMVPFKTLGLSYDYALDGWGRDITYAVDTGATNQSPGTSSITISDYGITNSSVIALVNHGQDGFGAWLPYTTSTGSGASRLNNGSTDTNQAANAQVVAASLPGSLVNNTSFGNFVNQAQSSTFDDTVVYKSSTWTINNIPAYLQAKVTTYPTAGNYSSPTALNFTITTTSPITVTGTPRLALIALGSGQIGTLQASGTYSGKYIAWANYNGVTGTPTTSLTFSYTIGSSDSAPSGISLYTPIDLTSGTPTISPCVPFTAPDLSGVIISTAVTLYIDDQAHNKMYSSPTSGALSWTSIAGPSGPSPGINSLATDNAGNIYAAGGTSAYIYKYNGSTWSTFTTSVSSPVAQAVDYTNGNVWVSNYGVNNVKKFPSTGGSGTTFSDSFSAPQAIWVDTASNVWVSDGNNNCIKEYTGSGWNTYSTCGTGGTAAGQFHSPVGIYVDPTRANVWIADNGNNRIQRCPLPSFSPCTTFGGTGTGTGAGQFNGPDTVRGDANGIIWVDDSGNNRIQKYDGTTWTIVGSTPAGASVWDALPVPAGTR